MRLIDQLKAEHLLIDQVAGSLIRFAEQVRGGETSMADAADLVHFFRVFVNGYHHQREEQSLFPALVERAEVPADHGPLAVIEVEHREAAKLVDQLQRAPDVRSAADPARRLARHLWEHVDKEDSVLLPESADRLRRNGITRLVGRAPTVEEESARRMAEQIIDRLPPLDDPEIVRGAGCIACSAFGETCGGIETEWWNTWERQHYRSRDEG
jgi:hemerythrin-like domain-containing protein